jgi:hypothetical protein
MLASLDPRLFVLSPSAAPPDVRGMRIPSAGHSPYFFVVPGGPIVAEPTFAQGTLTERRVGYELFETARTLWQTPSSWDGQRTVCRSILQLLAYRSVKEGHLNRFPVPSLRPLLSQVNEWILSPYCVRLHRISQERQVFACDCVETPPKDRLCFNLNCDGSLAYVARCPKNRFLFLMPAR